MRIEKERELLTFYLDDGKTVKYNLATGETIGKKGLPVKTLNSQLGKYSISEIIDSLEDEGYAKFLKWVFDSNERDIYNFGTLLEKAKLKSYGESWIRAGFCRPPVKLPLNEIPKWLVKYANKDSGKICSTVLHDYQNDPQLFQNLYNYCKEYSEDLLFNWYSVRKAYAYIFELIVEHNYSYKSLLNYMNNLMRFEAEDNFYQLSRILKDEMYMRKTMAEKSGCKYEKYPRYIRTTHNITTRNFNTFKKEYSEEIFADRIRPELEWQNDKYAIVVPKCTDDVKQEGIMQGNCVGGYIDDIISGKTYVVFLRLKELINKSLVTVEIRNNKIVQVEGTFRRGLTKEEKEVLKIYSQKVLTKFKK